MLYLSDVSCKSCSMKVNKMFVFAKEKKKEKKKIKQLSNKPQLSETARTGALWLHSVKFSKEK